MAVRAEVQVHRVGGLFPPVRIPSGNRCQGIPPVSLRIAIFGEGEAAGAVRPLSEVEGRLGVGSKRAAGDDFDPEE